MADELQMLPVNQLQPNPFQPRGHLEREDLEELVESVKQHGVLEPLVIAQTPAGYQIIAGERRWRAAKQAGITELPAVIKKTTPKGMLEMALVENIQRVDLSPLERAKAYQQLLRDFSLTVTEIGKRVGKSTPTVSNSLRLLELPDAIKDGLMSGAINEGHAKAILAVPTQEAQVDLYKTILKEGSSVRRAEELSRRFQDTLKQKVDKRKQKEITEAISKWQKRLEYAFFRESKVKVSRTSKQTKVTITIKGSPEETQGDFEKLLSLADKATKEEIVDATQVPTHL